VLSPCLSLSRFCPDFGGHPGHFLDRGVWP
jgi:hypothetical protein